MGMKQFFPILDGKTNMQMHSSDSLHRSDREIIGQLQEAGMDRRRSEEELFNTYSYFIREGMRKHTLSEDEAFNAYSDTILSAIAKITSATFEGRSSLKTYIHQIFHNKCVDLIRKKTTNKNTVNRSESISDMLLLVSDTAKSVVQKLIDKADWNLLKEKLNELDDKCRKLLLYWSDNYSDKQIATALLYKTADVVKTSRLRCLEKLRKLYKLT